MKSIALKIPESGRLAAWLNISRAEYVRMAIERMNQKAASRLRAESPSEVSRRVRNDSMRVNFEFAVIERDPDAMIAVRPDWSA